ncbi:MAG: NAD(P)H-dependent oxidoreductase [Candidatus Thorarchaeota archaeon]|nr:NAD(P)H-dependent oxidoreductase [Candidatus Thorarchaeota archaeon]
MSSKTAVLLIGSPRGTRSTSYSLGKYLIDHLDQFETSILHIPRTLRDQTKTQELLEQVNSADLVILSTPLYVDQLPAPVIHALELIDEYRKDSTSTSPKFVAIINCGFPENQHNAVALRICQHFAHKTGFEWAGSLSMGMGETISGRPLEDRGGMTRNIRSALEQAATALSEKGRIPEDVSAKFARPVIPIRLYSLIANRYWKRPVKKYGTKDRLKDRPCLQ